MTPLLLSVLALVGAPLLDRLFRGRSRIEPLVDGMIQVVVAGLVLVHVLPFSVATAGWPAVVALALGFLAGLAAHRLPGGDRSAGTLAVVALLVHAAVDGVALASPDGHDHAAPLLAWAVVLHTLPVGLATWRLGAPRMGAAVAFSLLVATAVSTAVGFYAAETMLDGVSPALAGLTQCAVAGMLLHMLGHLGEGSSSRQSGWGALIGVGVVGVVGYLHPVPRVAVGELGAGRALLTLLLEASPALLVGYAAAGGLHAFAPASLERWMTGRTALGSAVRGAAVGLPVPVCSCGALPVYRGLLERGAPAAAALSFLVAGPEVGVATLLVSVPLLGLELTGIRLVAALIVALAAGAVVGARVPTSVAVPGDAEAPKDFAARLREGARFGFIETVDHTAVWVLAGLLVAGLAEPLLAPDALRALPEPVAVVVAALIGIPLYVCAAGATPLAAVLLHKGLSAGAVIAFLLTGPATNISTFGVLTEMHGRRLAGLFGVVVAGAAIAVGLSVDALFPVVTLPAFHEVSDHAHGWIEQGSAVAVLALFAATLVRRGPSGFVDPLVHTHAHDDCDDDGCGHDHGHGHHHHGHSHAPAVTLPSGTVLLGPVKGGGIGVKAQPGNRQA